MYTITRKSSSRRQSSNSADSYDNVCSNNVQNNSQHPQVTSNSRFPLKRSSDTGIESMYLETDDQISSRCAKSPALDLSCSPNRSRVVSWLNQSSDYLVAGSSSKVALEGCGYLSPASSSQASSRTASPGRCSSSSPEDVVGQTDFDRMSCESSLDFPKKSFPTETSKRSRRRRQPEELGNQMKDQCHVHPLDGMGYLTPPIMSSSSCCSPSGVNHKKQSQKVRCSSFSSSSSVSSTSSLFSSSIDSASHDHHDLESRSSLSGNRADQKKLSSSFDHVFKKDRSSSDNSTSFTTGNNVDQFSCLYLLASAAVNELERQRTSFCQTSESSDSPSTSSSCLLIQSNSPSSPQSSSSPCQAVPFKKRNHLMNE